MKYEEILYSVREGGTHITINRPDKYNAVCGQTCDEFNHAFNRAK